MNTTQRQQTMRSTGSVSTSPSIESLQPRKEYYRSPCRSLEEQWYPLRWSPRRPAEDNRLLLELPQVYTRAGKTGLVVDPRRKASRVIFLCCWLYRDQGKKIRVNSREALQKEIEVTFIDGSFKGPWHNYYSKSYYRYFRRKKDSPRTTLYGRNCVVSDQGVSVCFSVAYSKKLNWPVQRWTCETASLRYPFFSRVPGRPTLCHLRQKYNNSNSYLSHNVRNIRCAEVRSHRTNTVLTKCGPPVTTSRTAPTAETAVSVGLFSQLVVAQWLRSLFQFLVAD